MEKTSFIEVWQDKLLLIEWVMGFPGTYDETLSLKETLLGVIVTRGLTSREQLVSQYQV